MELLKTLYCIHSKSNKEDKMLNFLVDWLFDNLPTATIEMDEKCNLYVQKGESDTYPCVVAHVDQVQVNHSDDFEAVETSDIIFGWSSKNKRYEGLGADDKNGVWIALKCLLKYDVLKVALFVGEEIGCVGSENADMDFFKDCRFVLQCDRRGYNDFITEASFTELCDKSFTDDVHYDWFGYKEASGMMTDVMTLKENGLSVACANISCGYYEPHTDREFTIKNDLMNCLLLVEYIIENCTKVYTHEYVYKPKTYGYGYYDKNHVWHSSYYKSSYNNSAKVCNTQTEETKEEMEENSQSMKNEGIQPFFDDEKEHKTDNSNLNDDDFIDYADDQSWLDEINSSSLPEEIRDELYDVIYSLLSDCPNASCDMIYSALKNTYPNLSWDDARASYYEVKYDMKKYMLMTL